MSEGQLQEMERDCQKLNDAVEEADLFLAVLQERFHEEGCRLLHLENARKLLEARMELMAANFCILIGRERARL